LGRPDRRLGRWGLRDNGGVEFGRVTLKDGTTKASDGLAAEWGSMPSPACGSSGLALSANEATPATPLNSICNTVTRFGRDWQRCRQ